jgi:lactoylglutathione lyase
MKIEHIAMWVQNIEVMKNFYEKYFSAKAGKLYHNPSKKFTSYFLSFQGGCRLELMYKPNLYGARKEDSDQSPGLIHLAISVGSEAKVDLLTDRLSTDGYTILGAPRTTGDGYYESVILDPENNRIEITV